MQFVSDNMIYTIKSCVRDSNDNPFLVRNEPTNSKINYRNC